MRYTNHFQARLYERAGMSARAFVRLMGKLRMPDGAHRTDFGTIIVKDGVLITFLTPEMAVVR